MGISGLLPLLSDAAKKGRVDIFRGKTVGIDASTWLHKGAYGCATALARGEDTDSFLRYFMHYINLLRHHEVVPYVVFDGAPLPMKKLTNDRRGEDRRAAKAKGDKLFAAGDTMAAEAQYQKCIRVTGAMRGAVVQQLRQDKVRFVVAPYEADAQLQWLFKAKLVQAVITEDSDLAAYGCTNLFTKMDKNGFGVHVDLSGLSQVKDFGNFKGDMFMDMCILSGCDYVDRVPGLGLKTAQKLIIKYKNIGRVIRQLKCEPKWKDKVPDSYADDVTRAKLTFKHHFLWDPNLVCGNKVVPLSEFEPPKRDERDRGAAAQAWAPRTLAECETFLGDAHGDGKVAQKIAEGRLDPNHYQKEVERGAKEKEATQQARIQREAREKHNAAQLVAQQQAKERAAVASTLAMQEELAGYGVDASALGVRASNTRAGAAAEARHGAAATTNTRPHSTNSSSSSNGGGGRRGWYISPVATPTSSPAGANADGSGLSSNNPFAKEASPPGLSANQHQHLLPHPHTLLTLHTTDDAHITLQLLSFGELFMLPDCWQWHQRRMCCLRSCWAVREEVPGEALRATPP